MSLLSSDPYLTVSPPLSGPWVSLPGNDSRQPRAGDVRYTNSALEVYTGYNWAKIDSEYTSISLNPVIHDVVTWALRKMEEERRINELAEQFPGIADLKAKLDTMIALAK